jgi:hypothetical protein
MEERNWETVTCFVLLCLEIFVEGYEEVGAMRRTNIEMILSISQDFSVMQITIVVATSTIDCDVVHEEGGDYEQDQRLGQHHDSDIVRPIAGVQVYFSLRFHLVKIRTVTSAAHFTANGWE